MTEKRYFLHKHLIKNDVIHDKICHRWLKGEELESDMNTLYNKYSSLKRENEQLKKIIEDNVDFKTIFSDRDLNDICNEMGYELSEKEIKLQRLEKENEQLKQQISELKKDVPLLLAFYRWYPFAVEKKEHQAYNRLWDFVND